MAEPTHTTSTEHAPAGEHGGGFPPFNTQTFPSQLIWLVITFVLVFLLAGCGTLAGFHYSGNFGIKWNDLFSLTFIETQIDIYRVDDCPETSDGHDEARC